MYVANSWYEILDALAGAVLTTADIRREIGKDPHPTLGRMHRKAAIMTFAADYWELTDIGQVLLELGRLER